MSTFFFNLFNLLFKFQFSLICSLHFGHASGIKEFSSSAECSGRCDVDETTSTEVLVAVISWATAALVGTWSGASRF